MASPGVAPTGKLDRQGIGMRLEQISDPEERKVLQAVASPKWDFRTLDGISKDTGLPQTKIQEILDKYPQLVRKSAVPDRRGRELYTLKSRPVKGQEILAIVRTFVSKTVR